MAQHCLHENCCHCCALNVTHHINTGVGLDTGCIRWGLAITALLTFSLLSLYFLYLSTLQILCRWVWVNLDQVPSLCVKGHGKRVPTPLSFSSVWFPCLQKDSCVRKGFGCDHILNDICILHNLFNITFSVLSLLPSPSFLYPSLMERSAIPVPRATPMTPMLLLLAQSSPSHFSTSHLVFEEILLPTIS